MSLNDDEKKILSKIQLFQKAVSLYKLVRSDINRLQVYSYADDFTFFFFYYLITKCKKNNSDTKINIDKTLNILDAEFTKHGSLLHILKVLNEKDNVYSEDKPNFALHIACILYYDKYKYIFDQDDLSFLYQAFEQFSFTGIFGLKNKKRTDSINFFQHYPEIVKSMIENKYPILSESTIYHKVTNILSSDFFSRDKQIEYDDAHYNSVRIQTLRKLNDYVDSDSIIISDVHRAIQKLRNKTSKRAHSYNSNDDETSYKNNKKRRANGKRITKKRNTKKRNTKKRNTKKRNTKKRKN